MVKAKAAAKAAAAEELKEPPIDEALAEQEKADAAVVDADKLGNPDDAARADLDAARDAYTASITAVRVARETALGVVGAALDALEASPTHVVVSDAIVAAVQDVANAAVVAQTALDTHVSAHAALDADDYEAARAALASKRPAYLAARADQVADHPKKGK